MSSASGAGRRWGFRAVGLIGGVVLALALAEGALQLAGTRSTMVATKRVLISPYGPTLRYFCYDSNPNGELAPPPPIYGGGWTLLDYSREHKQLPMSRLKETPWCVEERISRGDLRDREYAARPAPGTVRILGMGDSFGRGEGVPRKLGMFKQLERRLGHGFEVLNGAMPGLTIAAEIPRLRQLTRRFHCTRALVVFNINDIGLTAPLTRRSQQNEDLINVRAQYSKQARGWLGRRLRLPRALGSWFELRQIHRRTLQVYLDSYAPRHNKFGLQELRRSFKTLATLKGVRATLVLFPLLVEQGGEYPFAEIHRRVKAMAEQAGLPTLDLAPVFAGRAPCSLWVHPVDHHPNGEAHGLAADAVARWLRAEQAWFLRP